MAIAVIGLIHVPKVRRYCYLCKLFDAGLSASLLSAPWVGCAFPGLLSGFSLFYLGAQQENYLRVS